jgi:K+-transporting ATPase ATPase C chain
MLSHCRATLILVVSTIILCCVVYPLALWAIAQSAFREQAEGSLLRDKDGKVVGSRLIAQPFTADEYFQPRPSAVGYNAAASGASNWGASNYLLRDRVARQLGPLVRYDMRSPIKPGQPVAGDIEAWFQKQPPDFATRWAKDHPKLAGQWVKDHTEVVAAWLGKDEEAVKDNAEDCAKAFFPAYVEKHPGTWPTAAEKIVEGKVEKKLQPAREGADVQSYLFDPWLQANPNVLLEKVPADLVTASGSGLDPHITLSAALYQLNRVAAARAKKAGRPETEVRAEIEALLRARASAPLGGLAGVPLVNVLEVNVELDAAGGRKP